MITRSLAILPECREMILTVKPALVSAALADGRRLVHVVLDRNRLRPAGDDQVDGRVPFETCSGLRRGAEHQSVADGVAVLLLDRPTSRLAFCTAFSAAAWDRPTTTGIECRSGPRETAASIRPPLTILLPASRISADHHAALHRLAVLLGERDAEPARPATCSASARLMPASAGAEVKRPAMTYQPATATVAVSSNTSSSATRPRRRLWIWRWRRPAGRSGDGAATGRDRAEAGRRRRGRPRRRGRRVDPRPRSGHRMLIKAGASRRGRGDELSHLVVRSSSCCSAVGVGSSSSSRASRP